MPADAQTTVPRFRLDKVVIEAALFYCAVFPESRITSSASALQTMMTDPDRDEVDRVTRAFLQMKKSDLATLQRAYEGR